MQKGERGGSDILKSGKEKETRIENWTTVTAQVGVGKAAEEDVHYAVNEGGAPPLVHLLLPETPRCAGKHTGTHAEVCVDVRHNSLFTYIAVCTCVFVSVCVRDRESE